MKLEKHVLMSFNHCSRASMYYQELLITRRAISNGQKQERSLKHLLILLLVLPRFFIPRQGTCLLLCRGSLDRLWELGRKSHGKRK